MNKRTAMLINFNISKIGTYMPAEIEKFMSEYEQVYSSEYEIIHDIRELDGHGDLIHFVLAVPKVTHNENKT